jgi:2-polyprenyl-3-methyl-5-hydroxy-6-metoxy-1,4-benzoquinol methylase
MNDVQEINVDELMTQIRENLPNQQRTPAVGATTPSSNGLVAAELSALQSSREIRYFHLTSHRKFLGAFVLLAKKGVRKLLTPSLERQSGYNTANIRLAAHLWEHAKVLQKISQELGEQIKEFRQELTTQGREVRQELTAQGREVRQELTEQAEQRYQELAEQIGGVHQEQGAALQAIRVELAEQIGGLHRDQAADLQALRGELTAQMRETHQEYAAGLQRLRAQLVEEVARVRQEHTVALQEMRERSSRAERRVRRFVAALTDGPNADSLEVKKSLPLPKAVLEGNAGPYFDYFGFEERFRGNEEDIKELQRVYVEFFKEAPQVLDIGCGRGEFLELMTEAGIRAKGVDLNLDMVLYCQEKGLDVVREEAYTYLESLPDESLGGLFAAQLVEHLEPTRIIELVNLCQRKLQPGGVLIFETPNPACLTVFAQSFYMDFSHIRPIHPEAMKFLFESAGFQNLQVKFSSPVEPSMGIPPLSGIAADPQATEEFNRGIARLNELLYGFQDYAVIGRKSYHA